jgi:GT2 family glycosyltransferase
MKKYPFVSVVIPTHNRKEKLVRLIRSVLNSNYPRKKLEIIVVDDASTDGTYEEIKKKFSSIKVIRNQKEMLVSGSRNIGIKNSRGEYIFLIDDDNVVDKHCIRELVKVMKSDSSIGIVGPLMYYLKQPKRIWCAGIRRNMIISLTFKIGADKIDKRQFNKLIYSDDFPNAFMIRKEVIEKVGLFDENNFPIHYDEADFGERVRKAGYRIVCNPKAKIWHDIPLPEEVEDKARLFHVHSEMRAYYAGRNRIIFHKKYSKWWQFLLFILIFNWLFTMYYLKIILFDSHFSISNRIKISKCYLRGVLCGIKKESTEAWLIKRGVLR